METRHTAHFNHDIPFVGAWKLASFTLTSPQQEPKSWRSHSHGLLIYTANKYMSVSINSEVTSRPTSQEKEILDSVLFYSGTYEVSEQSIIHKVTNATDPARIGQNLIRTFHLENNILTLTANGPYGTAELKWEKIK